MAEKIIKDYMGRPRYWFIDEDHVVYQGVNWERDPDNGRCYYLEASTSLRPEMDGALVKRRTSNSNFEIVKEAVKKIIENGGTGYKE